MKEGQHAQVSSHPPTPRICSCKATLTLCPSYMAHMKLGRNVVVIGGGFGGLAVTRELAKMPASAMKQFCREI